MASLPGPQRLILDVSTIARWAGSPTGITRVEQALARYARDHRPDIVLALFDSQALAFRRISDGWADRLIGWDAALDCVSFDDRRHRTLLRRLRYPRYPLLMTLERRRIRTHSRFLRHAMERVQRAVCLGRDLPDVFIDRKRRRLGVIPADLALEEALTLGPGDTVVTVGCDWGNQRPDRILALKRRHGFRYVTLCYDLIALQFPQYLPALGVAAFDRYWQSMFAKSDRILVLSRHVADDIGRHCAENGMEPAEIRVVQPGFDALRTENPASLPDGLEHGHYILYVSTIEPRKGHGMLLDIWERLLEAGVPQRHRFKLVFVGRRGWQVDALMKRIEAHPALGDSFLHLLEVDNGGLAFLYANAAFCVFPSRYEGFGLSVIECFSHRKAIIASTAGALPEAVNGLSPCLDPEDSDAWFAALSEWIEDPTARLACEQKIGNSFTWPDWTEASARMLAAADA